MKNSVYGICRLCGKKKQLTFEHVPPEKAFNFESVWKYSVEDAIEMLTGAGGRMPWDFSGLHGHSVQRGGGDYYLCNDCNSKTGSWYISEYVKLAATFDEIIRTEKAIENSYYSFNIYDVFPLRILKAVMTMYCDINESWMGDKSLRDFLLNKESKDFNSERYKLYMYMVSPEMRRINGLVTMVMGDRLITLSEIGSYPIGTILCIDKPDNFVPNGLLMNSFADYGYFDKANIEFCGIPYYQINSLFPNDFRQKDYFLNLHEGN